MGLDFGTVYTGVMDIQCVSGRVSYDRIEVRFVEAQGEGKDAD
jgi:hypothetical protein